MNRLVLSMVATGVAAASLSYPAGPARADGSSTGPTAYSGYSSSGIATPVKVEIFEPTIPIPTVPQAEFDMGYAKVKANSSSTKGRASFVWPGDGVGEGLKTFFAQLGLPTALVESGYPVQVNSEYPGETPTQKNSPFPGTSMTTTSGKGETRATVGFSNDCDAGDGGAEGDGDGAGGDQGGGLLPGLPELPGVPGIPLLDELTGNLDDVLGLLGLGSQKTAAAPSVPSASGASSASRAGTEAVDEPDAPSDSEVCQLPALLSLLVDVNGYVADSHSVSDGSTVTSTSRSALGDVRLLGGIVTMSGITSTVVSSSDGITGRAEGQADYGTVTIAGQTFGLGPEGYVAAGQSSPIPGLPNDPLAALAALGITVELPQPTYKADGDKASGTIEGLIVTIDLKTLRPVLSQLDLSTILAQIPFPPQAAMLKSLLGAVGNLSPKIVMHLGYSTSAVDTVQPIPIPEMVPDNDPTDEPTSEPTKDPGGTSTGGATGGTGGTSGGTGLGGGTTGLPPANTSVPAPAAAPEQLSDASLTSGLPPLFSIPGLVLFAGLGGALLAGSYLRKLGALILGVGGACPHGLESGLPDLRKVQ